jgi:putative serine protease PepD
MGPAAIAFGDQGLVIADHRRRRRPHSFEMTNSRLIRRGLAVSAIYAVVATALVVGGCGGSKHSTTGAAADPFDGLQQKFTQVVKQVSPAVVQIESSRGLGSGVVYDFQGDVVTNAHVVQGSKQFQVTLPGGDRHPATLVGADTSHDLAIVHISGATPPPAKFAASPEPEAGDLVLAIGNPLGLRSSVTQGIVSSIRPAVPEGNGVTLSPAIQTSAAINPGNSGGALADLDGRVIGIPTLAALDPEMGDAQAPGIGFAIPSSTVQQVAGRLLG